MKTQPFLLGRLEVQTDCFCKKTVQISVNQGVNLHFYQPDIAVVG